MSDPRLIARVKEHEGFSAAPYADTRGTLTIGFGHAINDGPPLTEATAAALLSDDLNYSAHLVDGAFAWVSRLPIDDARRSVMVELCFNLGRRGLLGFHKMLDAAAHNDWETAANELLNSAWAKQVGPHRSQRLAGILRSGEWA